MQLDYKFISTLTRKDSMHEIDHEIKLKNASHAKVFQAKNKTKPKH